MPKPLDEYRRTQHELRRHFDAFTSENCATCPTPCCLRPARIAPTDILLAEATGWRAGVLVNENGLTTTQAGVRTDMVPEIAGRLADALAGDDADQTAGLPCEFLGERGCTFPSDLRPFGCTAYICKYMYRKLDRTSLARIKRLVRDLDDKHTLLLRVLR